jgi:hypothetical protein
MVATVFQNGYKHAKALLPHQQVAQTHRQRIKDMLPNRVVGYSPDLARTVGGATTGLYLSQLLFLSDKGANPDGWVYKSEAEEVVFNFGRSDVEYTATQLCRIDPLQVKHEVADE